MMFLGEENDLLMQYLQHPEFEKFETKTPKLQELTRQ